MKFALCLVLLAIGAPCIVAQNITSWGDVANSQMLREVRVVVPYQILRVQNRTVTFNTNGNTRVRGVTHIDYQTTFSTPRIVRGGIGFNTVSLNILSQRSYGINSTVRFFV